MDTIPKIQDINGCFPFYLLYKITFKIEAKILKLIEKQLFIYLLFNLTLIIQKKRKPSQNKQLRNKHKFKIKIKMKLLFNEFSL